MEKREWPSLLSITLPVCFNKTMAGYLTVELVLESNSLISIMKKSFEPGA
jgi:hypothetical protein